MLTLASGSPHRRSLLERLQLPFRCEVPAIDETPRPGEPPAALAERLAREKAAAVAERHAGSSTIIIGADQVADWNGTPLGKPGSLTAAARQLRRLSGHALTLHTGLCLLRPSDGRERWLTESFRVQFRTLDATAIDRYLGVEQPLDAAGSFYSERYGIVLFESFSGRDPNALIGLPLMALVDLLKAFGVRLP